MSIEQLFDTLEVVELAADLTPDALHDVLAELGERVAPTSLARDRLLPVHSALQPLFPDGGLVRGRVHACEGTGGTTVALAMAREAVLAGAWMAVVDVATLGVDAAHELGVALERVVRIDTAVGAPGVTAADEPGETAAEVSGDVGRRWVEVMAAAVDGFDVVVATVPEAWRTGRASGAIRSLVARLQQRGSIIILLGSPGVVPVDVSVSARGVWGGLGWGHGVIGRSRLDVRSSGRRQPQLRSCSLELVAAGARLELRSALGSDGESELDVAGQAAGERGPELRLVAG